MKSWSEIQMSYPFFWLWLNAWLKKKGAESLRVCYDDASSDYVKVRFNIPSYKERELSEEMMNDVFDEAGVRVCVNFDHEADKQPWRYVIYRRKVQDIWIQTYSSGYDYPNQKSVKRNGYLFAIEQVDESLKKQNSVEQIWIKS